MVAWINDTQTSHLNWQCQLRCLILDHQDHVLEEMEGILFGQHLLAIVVADLDIR